MRHTLPEGLVLNGRYRINGFLGQGGFGITYLAENTAIGQTVAIKELYIRDIMGRDVTNANDVFLFDAADRDHLEKYKKDLQREARIIGRFGHCRHLVSVIDHFEENGTAYMVMEYIPGQNLSEYIREKGKIPAKEAILRFLPLMKDLQQVHRARVIHRDISPDNIRVTPKGDLVLMDFGASRDYDGDRTLSRVLKEGYAPIEQSAGHEKQGPWTDVYALSATIYETITGKAPEHATARLLYDELKRPSECGILIDEEIEKILMKGLAVQAEDRYQTVEEMQNALHEIVGSEEELEQERLAAEKQRQRKRRRIRLAVAAVSVLALVIGFFCWKRAQEYHYDPDRDYRVWFTTGDMTEEEAAEGKKILQERLSLFADRDRYQLEDKGDELALYVPKEYFHGRNVVETVKTYLTRPAKVSLTNQDPEATEDQPVLYLEDGDITGVEICEGSIDEVDATEYEIYEDTYDYLHVTLSAEAAKMAAELEREGKADNYMFWQDTDLENVDHYHGFSAFPGEEEGSFDVIVPTAAENFLQTVVYNWTHAHFATAFPVTEDLDQETEWQTVENNTNRGKAQENAAAVTGDMVTVDYTCYDDNITPGDELDTELELKRRLDLLDRDYCYGTYEDMDGLHYVFRTDRTCMGEPVIDLLGEGSSYASFYLETEGIQASISMEDSSVKLLSYADGTYGLQVTLRQDGEKMTDLCQGITEYLQSQAACPVYMEIASNRYLKTEDTDQAAEGIYVFNCMYDENGKECEITEQDLWLLQLIMSLWESDTETPSLTMERYQFSVDLQEQGAEATGVFGRIGPEEADAVEAVRRIESAVDGVEAQWKGSALRVWLDLPVDEDLPLRTTELAKEVMEQVDLQEAAYSSICIYPTQTEANEAVGVYIWRENTYASKYTEEYPLTAGGWTASCEMGGGRLEQYSENFMKMVNAWWTQSHYAGE